MDDISMPTAAPPQASKIASSDLCHDLELAPGELRSLLTLAADVKQNPARYARNLQGRYLALLFEKPSLRTRLTFELAMQQLGGGSVTNMGPVGGREPLPDVARNLDRWTQGIVARVFSQQTIDELAQYSRVPVINALSDLYHPCQALADTQTLLERFPRLAGLKLAYIGDGNNVAHSLLLTPGRLGVHIAIACPKGFEPNPEILRLAASHKVSFEITNDPEAAATDAHAVYTDVWASMGQEDEAAHRREVFAGFQVTPNLMARALPEAIFLHCLPAKRGEEVTHEVMESPQSAVFDQAENRLHAQKALLLMLLS
jgi:ornithine carbamoyltransferase